MSSSYYEIFFEMEGELNNKLLYSFLDCTERKDFSNLKKLDVNDLFTEEQIEHYFNARVILEEHDKHFVVSFETHSSMVAMDVVDFFVGLGCSGIEVVIYDSSSGEYLFCTEFEEFDCYEEHCWNYIDEREEFSECISSHDIDNEHEISSGMRAYLPFVDEFISFVKYIFWIFVVILAFLFFKFSIYPLRLVKFFVRRKARREG